MDSQLHQVASSFLLEEFKHKVDRNLLDMPWKISLVSKRLA